MAKQDTKTDFKEKLRKVGLKATPARVAVLTTLQASRHPLSAQGMIEKVKGVDQATIYRILTNLKLRGIIKQIDLRHNHAHFELADVHDHHHLVCSQCGRIEDIEGCEVEGMYASIMRMTRQFAEVKQHSLEFYGLCKSCARGKNLLVDKR